MASSSTIPADPPADKQVQPDDALVQQVVRALHTFVEPDSWTELRAVEVDLNPYRDFTRPPCTLSGYFRRGAQLRVEGESSRVEALEFMAYVALTVTADAKNVYFLLNPLRPEVADQADDAVYNQAAVAYRTTRDSDVLCRHWFGVDVDPVRDHPDNGKISSTDEEKARALKVAKRIRRYLTRKGWPPPILLDSGNGFWLLFLIDLPNDPESKNLIKRALEALAHRYDSDGVEIDRKLYNAARVCKLPGTWAKKGENTSERPHRRAKLVSVPGDLEVVGKELLTALADEAPKPTPRQRQPGTPSSTPGGTHHGPYKHRLLVEMWLGDRGVSFRVKSPSDGWARYEIPCPFDASHGRDACVFQAVSGAMAASCFHNGCANNRWKEFKAAIGPPDANHYTPPLEAPKSRPRIRQITFTVDIEDDA